MAHAQERVWNQIDFQSFWPLDKRWGGIIDKWILPKITWESREKSQIRESLLRFLEIPLNGLSLSRIWWVRAESMNFLRLRSLCWMRGCVLRPLDKQFFLGKKYCMTFSFLTEVYLWSNQRLKWTISHGAKFRCLGGPRGASGQRRLCPLSSGLGQHPGLPSGLHAAMPGSKG